VAPRSAGLRREYKRLVTWADELSDETKNYHFSELVKFRFQVLDFLNLWGLGNNAVYREIEALNWRKPLPAGAGSGPDGAPSRRQILFTNYCYENLEVLKRGLKLGGQLFHRLPSNPADTESQGTSRLRPYQRGEQFAQTVEQLEREFRILAGELQAPGDYRGAKKRFPNFVAFKIVEAHRTLKPMLFELKERSGYKTLAREFAGRHHHRSPETIRKACRKSPGKWKRKKRSAIARLGRPDPQPKKP
jgi:hypothetical protein